MGTAQSEIQSSLPRIFKGRRGLTGRRRSRGALQGAGPYLGANPFQGALPFTKKRELSPGSPPASPGSFALPHRAPPARGCVRLRSEGSGIWTRSPFDRLRATEAIARPFGTALPRSPQRPSYSSRRSAPRALTAGDGRTPWSVFQDGSGGWPTLTADPGRPQSVAHPQPSAEPWSVTHWEQSAPVYGPGGERGTPAPPLRQGTRFHVPHQRAERARWRSLSLGHRADEHHPTRGRSEAQNLRPADPTAILAAPKTGRGAPPARRKCAGRRPAPPSTAVH
ncbi:unnamed protein product [Lampetra planeri]